MAMTKWWIQFAHYRKLVWMIQTKEARCQLRYAFEVKLKVGTSEGSNKWKDKNFQMECYQPILKLRDFSFPSICPCLLACTDFWIFPSINLVGFIEKEGECACSNLVCLLCACNMGNFDQWICNTSRKHISLHKSLLEEASTQPLFSNQFPTTFQAASQYASTMTNVCSPYFSGHWHWIDLARANSGWS